MKKFYWKALTVTLMVASANYWYGSLISAYFNVFGKDSDPLESYGDIITVALFLPNAIFALPILTGIMIDYIGVIPLLQYTNFTYLLGAAMLVPGYLYQNAWVVILASLFFGFSLMMSFSATYIYLCNTYITKTKSLKHFKPVLGIYISLGYGLLCVRFIKSDNFEFALGFGGGLILLSTLMSFFLKVKPAQGKALLDASNQSVAAESPSLIVRAETFEGTFIEYNEKYDQDEINVEPFFEFLKNLGAKGKLKIACLGIITGLSLTHNGTKLLSSYFDNLPPIVFSIHFAFFAVFGLILPCFTWSRSRIEKSILAAGFVFLVCMVLAGVDIPEGVSLGIFIAKNIAQGVLCYTIYLYFPYVIEFKVGNMGKAIGTFWWIVSLQMFMSTRINRQEMSLQSLSYDLTTLLPAGLAVFIFSIILCVERKDGFRNRSISMPISI